MSEQPTDRRERKRTAYAADLVLDSGGERISGCCVDLSMGGAKIASLDGELSVGDKGVLQLEQTVGDQHLRIEAEAEVIRLERDKDASAMVALRFLKLEPEYAIALYNIVRYQLGEMP